MSISEFLWVFERVFDIYCYLRPQGCGIQMLHGIVCCTLEKQGEGFPAVGRRIGFVSRAVKPPVEKCEIFGWKCEGLENGEFLHSRERTALLTSKSLSKRRMKAAEGSPSSRPATLLQRQCQVEGRQASRKNND
jgi:hypothetical protein